MTGGRPAETETVNLSGEYSEIWTDYCEAAKGQYDASKTFERRKRGTKYWLDWCETRNLDPEDIEENDVRTYIREIQNLSDNTIAARISSVSMLYEWMSEHIDFTQDGVPTENIHLRQDYGVRTNTPEYVKILAKEGEENIRALPPSRVEKLFDHPGNPSDRNLLILQLLWQTGLRAEELSRVKLDNIDLENREIKIRSAKLNPDDHPELYIRRVYFRPNLDWLLRNWINERRYAHSKYADESPYLLLTSHKDQIRPAYINKIVKRAADRAGIQEKMYVDQAGNDRWLVTAHRLRHSAITHWVESGMAIDKVRMLAGHAKLETTMTYVTTDWEDVREEYHTTMA